VRTVREQLTHEYLQPFMH